VPPSDGGDDFVGVCGSNVKGFGSALVSARKRLMAAWRSTTERKTPRFKRRLDSLAKKPSTALSQKHEVGWPGLRSCHVAGPQTFDGASTGGRSNALVTGGSGALAQPRNSRRRMASNNSERDRGQAHRSETAIRHRRNDTSPLGRASLKGALSFCKSTGSRLPKKPRRAVGRWR
jgi:hypothetical protein